MELPNYNKQLMQQLRALRTEGIFCDCTILVGETSHRAHKLVLAASSMLFRSLLEASDTISIDTAVVSSQEFVCLLDMVYTGKLPPGLHNLSRIIAASDSLQMFHVAVGCKNILSRLMGPQPPAVMATAAHLTGAQVQAEALHRLEAPVESDVEARLEGMEEEEEAVAPGGDSGDSGSNKQQAGEAPSPKRARLDVPERPHSEVQGSISPLPHENESAGIDPVQGAEECGPRAGALLERSSELAELLAKVPSMTELLSQVASSTLEIGEKEVVLECCAEQEAPVAAQKLVLRLREGVLSEAGLLVVLGALREVLPSSCTPGLLALLEEVEAEGSKMGEEPEKGQQTQEPEKDQQTQEPEKDQQTQEPEKDQQTQEPEKDQQTQEPEKDQQEPGTTGSHSEEDEEKEEGSGDSPESQPSQPYRCRWCKKGFAFKCRLRAHLKCCAMSQEPKHQCPQCPKRLPTVRALQHHRLEAHPQAPHVKKKVSCDLCRRTFAHPSGMIYHKRTEHFEEKPFACDDCGAKFAANSSLKNHIRLHTGEKPYHCKHCDMSFSVAAALAYHTKKKHSEGKMYACQYCEALFAQSIELTRHVRTHTGDRPYVCRECGKGYSQASGLTVHLQTYHNILEPHDCQKCRLSFSSVEEHRHHLQDCHPKDFHRCPICQKVFNSTTLLEKHKSMHAGIKPYCCELCQKSYQQLSGLWYHNRTTHPEVYASQTNKSLKSLVQCDVCFKFFPSASSLSAHQTVEHSESAAMAVRCPHCPAVFAGEEELQEHASSQHFSPEGSALGCSLCPLVCPSQLQLQEHFLSCHTEALVEQEAGEGGEEEDAAFTSVDEVIPAEPALEGAETVLSLDQSQLGGSQQVYVALGGGAGGGLSTDMVAVNVDDLLNGTVTFICEDKQ